MRFEVTGITDIGCKRDNNEDNLLTDEAIGLFAVADGMGGLMRGEDASRIAIETLSEHIHSNVSPKDLLSASPEALLGHLKDAVRAADKAIKAQNCHGGGMGTTLTVLWLVQGKGLVAHVGDSRLYRHRAGKLRQLSRDHTLVESLVRSGCLSPREREDHPMSHVLLNSLGNNEALHIDMAIVDVRDDDAFLLCTDGLNRHVSDGEIADAFPDADLSLMGLDLLRMARRRGGLDNITLTLVRAEAERPEPRLGRLKQVFDTAMAWSL